MLVELVYAEFAIFHLRRSQEKARNVFLKKNTCLKYQEMKSIGGVGRMAKNFEEEWHFPHYRRGSKKITTDFY